MYVYIYIECDSTRKGEGGGGGGRGGGKGGRGGRGERGRVDLAAHLWVHTEGPPPPRWWFLRVGVSGEGIKRWGIEGIEQEPLTASAGAEAN